MIEIRALSQNDAPACAAIHAQSFEAGWDASSFEEYINPKNVALGAYDVNTDGVGTLIGFILMGAVTDQTDIITIAITPAARRRGIARQLVTAAESRAMARGAALIFLEAAEDNESAIALYRSCGYIPIGSRKNYYRRAGGRVSALTMQKRLKDPLARQT